jgi:hypothetical protein
MNDVMTIIVSLSVIAAFAIGGAGIYILARRPAAERKKGVLMIAVAVVTLANVWLLTAPVG